MVSAAVLISYKAYFGGTALTCWTPKQFRGGWDEYTNDYCLIENTYYDSLMDSNLAEVHEREQAKIPYYQWVPFMLALQALLFCFPHIYWRCVNWMSGVHLRAIVSMADNTIDYSQNKINFKKIKMIANHLYRGLHMNRMRHHHPHSSHPIAFCTRFLMQNVECYITWCYLVMKALFIANLLVQLTILNFFLDLRDLSSWTLGISLVIRLMKGMEWTTTGIFPRVTFCDFRIREFGGVQNLHRWTVQCVLPLNMFNEKIYIILWFWIQIVLIATVANMITWMVNILLAKRRRQFLDDILNVSQVSHPKLYEQLMNPVDKHDVTQLSIMSIMQQLYDKLGWDGVLILRIIKSNSGQFPCVEIFTCLYAAIANPLMKQRRPQREPGAEGEEHLVESDV